MADPSAGLLVAFVLLVLATAVLALTLVRRAHVDPDGQLGSQRSVFYAFVAVGCWMAFTAALAQNGVLSDFDRRPPLLPILVAVSFGLAVAIAFSRFGTRVMDGISLAWLIGFQGFRLPLELLMQRAAEEGVMPIQMSFSGQNLDIISGATALLIAWLISRGLATKRTPWLWNILGSALLINVLVVAILSLPMFARWGPEQLNIWVSHAPFVWLPTLLVPFALIAHLLLWRKLLRR
ncbi:MAG: hypothetical protein WCF10_16590 [Polyangiales bacterium]